MGAVKTSVYVPFALRAVPHAAAALTPKEKPPLLKSLTVKVTLYVLPETTTPVFLAIGAPAVSDVATSVPPEITPPFVSVQFAASSNVPFVTNSGPNAPVGSSLTEMLSIVAVAVLLAAAANKMDGVADPVVFITTALALPSGLVPKLSPKMFTNPAPDIDVVGTNRTYARPPLVVEIISNSTSNNEF